MILDNIENADRSTPLHPLFNKAFRFLEGVTAVSPGRVALEGPALYVTISAETGRSRAHAFLESHPRYIDIHFCIEGQEEIGWREVSRCRAVTSEYSEEKDLMTYADAPVTWCVLPVRSFAVFFPNDAHAPLVADRPFVKAVVKVAVS